MKKLLLGVILLLSATASFAQTREYERYDWDFSRKLDSLTSAEKKEGGICMLDKRIIEVAFDLNMPVVYSTRHMVVRLNTDFAIEYYNKIYVPMSNVIKMVDFRARFISKDGKVKDMDVSNVKDVENYDNAGPYKIYALEGIEVGGEIEYIYTVEKNWSSFGTEMYRSIYDYRAIELDIYTPDHLRYEGKSYNGLGNVHEDDYEGYADKRKLTMRAKNVHGYIDEPYSSSRSTYPRVEYKFAYNTGGGKRMNTWDDAAMTFYNMVYLYSPNEKRMAYMLLKKIGDSKTMNVEDRIRLIENYVKTNFTIRGDAEGKQFETVAGIITSKIATDVGIMKLYAALFEQAGIEMQLALTSDRFDKKFDGDFDSWTYLQYFLIHFPETQKFLIPGSEGNRYGFIPGELCGQDGLFVTKTSAGVMGEIKWISETTWSQNMNNMNTRITFDLTQGLAMVKTTHEYLGHSAAFVQPYINYMSTEDADEMVEGLLILGAHDARPKNVTYSGYEGTTVLFRDPFVVSGEFTTNSFLEKTCTNYIFKIGEVIGNQYNMYEDEERRTDISLSNPHGFKREITFEIPEGYRVTNLEALNMNVTDSTGISMRFHSEYTQSGNTVTVKVDESYDRSTYPIEMYAQFRAVMNASADFNKVVLYFEKI